MNLLLQILAPLLKYLKLFNVFDNLDDFEKRSHLYITFDKVHKKINAASVSQFDYILLSPSLKNLEICNSKPRIYR